MMFANDVLQLVRVGGSVRWRRWWLLTFFSFLGHVDLHLSYAKKEKNEIQERLDLCMMPSCVRVCVFPDS